MPNIDKVFVRDLVVVMSAGIYDHEKADKQRVVINIMLDVESNHGRTLGDIYDVVSYEKITNETIALCHAKHYELLEELAELIAVSCLKTERVCMAQITIEKPDIIPDTHSVGIEITRYQ